ncbi:MAG: response regulator transcription factor [Oscillospiraceae bacterium]|nr:response regulator transcription factor [Oscillospiraceae bacterium]
MRLLIAEDDIKLLKSLIYILQKDNYIVDGVSDGETAYDYASSGNYDGFIFDIMMPEADGIEVLTRLRKDGISAPALFLTALSDISDRVKGLDAGADDYLPKPFSTEELLARVRAMLRRRSSYSPDILEYNGAALDRSTCELCFENKKILLSGKEYQLMECLMRSPRVIISTEQLITRIWGWETEVGTNVVWVHIYNLRKKITAVKAPVEIRFVRGSGYVLEALK